MFTNKYTKTETSNMKTVMPSSSWSSENFPQVCSIKKIHRRLARTENLDTLKAEL